MGASDVSHEATVRVGLRRVQLLELVCSDPVLRGCALLRPLEPPQLEQLFAGALARRYADGAPVFQEGDVPRALYLVLQGEARVRVRAPGAGDGVEVAVVGKGDFFGEAELVDAAAGPAVATASARDCRDRCAPRFP